MKLKSKLILASVFAAIAANGSVRADSVTVSNQVVTIALTLTAGAPGTFAVDPDTGKLTKTPAFESQVDTLDKFGNVVKTVSTTSTKAVTSKYGNNEILTSIKDDLLDGVIKGWSIVINQDGETLAVKSGKENVTLDISGDADGGISLGTEVSTTTNKYDAEGSVLSTTNTMTATGLIDQGKTTFQILGSEAVGLLAQPYTVMAYYPDSADKSIQELEYIPGAGKITGIIGQAESTDINDNPITAIIGGTMTVSAAKGTLVKE